MLQKLTLHQRQLILKNNMIPLSLLLAHLNILVLALHFIYYLYLSLDFLYYLIAGLHPASVGPP